MKKNITDQKSVKIVTLILQILILITIIWSIVEIVMDKENSNGFNHIFLALLGLILLNVPAFIAKKWHLYIPSRLQIIAIVFIYAHFILGEIYRIYDYSLVFDKILHTTSGLAFAALGFSLVNLLNESKNTHLSLSPFFVALFSFCFSMMIAAVWEIYEFSIDSLTGANMQRWQIVGDVLNIKDPGRVGLIDTMGDIIVCFCGSLFVSVLGYISLKSKKNWLNGYLIRNIKDLDYASEEPSKSNDENYIEVVKELQEKEKNKKVNLG